MLEYASFSSIGDRTDNQDRFLVLANKTEGMFWFAIADGMGGHRDGAHAAEAAILAIEQAWQSEIRSSRVPDLIRQLITQAHRAVCALAEPAELRPPQTTLAVLIVSPDGAYSGHIGDTRVMQFNDAGLVKRTRDHSVTEEKFAAGKITDREMAFDPEHNLITQALGGTPALDIRIEEWELQSGELICLASDGAWILLPDSDYIDLLMSPDLRVAMGEILNARMQRAPDNQDNATVVAVRKQGR